MLVVLVLDVTLLDADLVGSFVTLDPISQHLGLNLSRLLRNTISLLLFLAARRPTLASGITATLSLVSTVIAVVLLYDHAYWIHEASKLPPHPGELADGCNRVLWTPMFSMATYTLIVTSFCVGSVWKLLKERRQPEDRSSESSDE